MKNRAFSLIEIMVTVVIVGILATVGLPYFQNVMETSKAKVCDTNLETLQKAVEMYTMEHDTVPGSLSELDDKVIQKAYASVMSGKGAWKKRLAYFLVEGPQWGLAYAQGFGMPRLRCPSNPDPSSISYGLHGGLSGMSALDYRNEILVPSGTVVVADSGAAVFYYSGAGGPVVSATKPHVPWAEIIQTRAHKNFRVLTPNPELSLRGVTKAGRTGRLTSGMFYSEND
jgi:prepilin-type N-terminal cleavage/methylation domain-containing protein